MAQPHLGPRKALTIRGVPVEVDVQRLAERAGYSAVSRYIADAFCDIAGRGDLKLGPDAHLPKKARPNLVRADRERTSYRALIPCEVSVEELAQKAGYGSASRFARDFLCSLAGRDELRHGPIQDRDDDSDAAPPNEQRITRKKTARYLG